jgi:hypothetical protein
MGVREWSAIFTTLGGHGLPWPWWRTSGLVGGRGEAGDEGVGGVEPEKGKEKGLSGVGVDHQSQPRS